MKKGIDLFNSEQLYQAKTIFNYVLEMDPQNQEAASYLARIKKHFDNIVLGFYTVGIREMGSGNLTEAKACFQKVLVIDPLHKKSKEMMIEIDKAVERMRLLKNEKEKIDHAGNYASLAREAFRKGNLESALKFYAKVLVVSPRPSGSEERPTGMPESVG